MKLPTNFKTKDATTVFVVAFVLLAIPLTVISVITNRDERSKAAGASSLYLSPATQSLAVGSNFAVQVRENSGTVAVTSATDISITYDTTKLTFVNVDPATAADFQSEAVTPTPPGDTSGTVFVSRFVTPFATCPPGTPVGTPCPATVTGDKLIATLHFTAKTVPATTSLAFAAGAAVYDNLGANQIGTTTGSTYTITDPPPTVNITSPANNTLVNGTITVNADATDNLGVSKVDFYVDSAVTPNATDTAPNIGTNTYSFILNTTTLTNAAHTIKAIATDANSGSSSSQISVTVDNSPPTGVAITSPANGLRVSKTVTVSASASDNRAVTKVEFYVDNGVTAKYTSLAAPYTFNWDTTLETSANHTLTAKAYDGINPAVTSAGVTVTVDNTPPTKPVLSGTAVSQTQINLSWTASTDTQGTVSYDVYRNSVKINLTPLTVLTYQDTPLVASTTYSYFVRASDQTPVPNTNDSTTVAIATLSPWKLGDVNHDGLVNSADLAILLSTWGSTIDLRADINTDGKIGSADLAVLLSRWGS